MSFLLGSEGQNRLRGNFCWKRVPESIGPATEKARLPRNIQIEIMLLLCEFTWDDVTLDEITWDDVIWGDVTLDEFTWDDVASDDVTLDDVTSDDVAWGGVT